MTIDNKDQLTGYVRHDIQNEEDLIVIYMKKADKPRLGSIIAQCHLAQHNLLILRITCHLHRNFQHCDSSMPLTFF